MCLLTYRQGGCRFRYDQRRQRALRARETCVHEEDGDVRFCREQRFVSFVILSQIGSDRIQSTRHATVCRP